MNVVTWRWSTFERRARARMFRVDSAPGANFPDHVRIDHHRLSTHVAKISPRFDGYKHIKQQVDHKTV